MFKDSKADRDNISLIIVVETYVSINDNQKMMFLLISSAQRFVIYLTLIVIFIGLPLF